MIEFLQVEANASSRLHFINVWELHTESSYQSNGWRLRGASRCEMLFHAYAMNSSLQSARLKKQLIASSSAMARQRAEHEVAEQVHTFVRQCRSTDIAKLHAAAKASDEKLSEAEKEIGLLKLQVLTMQDTLESIKPCPSFIPEISKPTMQTSETQTICTPRRQMRVKEDGKGVTGRQRGGRKRKRTQAAAGESDVICVVD